MASIPPLLREIRKEADWIAPHRSIASDGTLGDQAHSERTSDHNPDSRGIVHAIDLTHDPAHGFDARAEGERLRRRCELGLEQRVKYLVSYDDARRIDIIASQVRSPALAGKRWQWRTQSSRDHASHLHISIGTGPKIEASTDPMLRPLLVYLPEESLWPKEWSDDVPKPSDQVDTLSNEYGAWALYADGGVKTLRGPFYGSYFNILEKDRPGVRYFQAISRRVDAPELAGYTLAANDGSLWTFFPGLKGLVGM